MRLILHGGTHKTATTTFQAICSAARPLLQGCGLCFPAYQNWPQHSFAAWFLQERNDAALADFLAVCAAQARQAGCGTVLISGEDFENCLVETDLGRHFEAMARRAGFVSVEWIFVRRDPVDYLRSIYADEAKYEVVLNLHVMHRNLLRYGYTSLGGRNYNYKFVFDVGKFCAGFAREVTPAVELIDFDEFRRGFVGKVLLSRFLPPPVLDAVAALAGGIGRQNARLSEEIVEFLYACNFLNITPEAGTNRANSDLMAELVNARLSANARFDRANDLSADRAAGA